MGKDDFTYPGGQPYAPPRDLTEEEMEQVRQFLEEVKGRKHGAVHKNSYCDPPDDHHRRNCNRDNHESA